MAAARSSARRCSSACASAAARACVRSNRSAAACRAAAASFQWRSELLAAAEELLEPSCPLVLRAMSPMPSARLASRRGLRTWQLSAASRAGPCSSKTMACQQTRTGTSLSKVVSEEQCRLLCWPLGGGAAPGSSRPLHGQGPAGADKATQALWFRLPLLPTHVTTINTCNSWTMLARMLEAADMECRTANLHSPSEYATPYTTRP
jgi:hypothetical protein